MGAIELIREQITQCELAGVEFLCCPEAVLGGLADYAPQPSSFAINVGSGQLEKVLAPLASTTVTTILGFTEIDAGRLYNSAAIFHRGSVIGVYRKLHPAINKSIYEAGDEMPVFTVGDLTFGVVICRDSSYAEPARVMTSRGATALFVPTNNAMPAAKGGPKLVAEARNADIACARENLLSIIRADVAGRAAELVSYGSSSIVDSRGIVLASSRQMTNDLLIADIERRSIDEPPLSSGSSPRSP